MPASRAGGLRPPLPPSSIAQPRKPPMARLGQPPLVPLPTPDNPSWSPHPPRTTQLGPLLIYLLYAMLLLLISRNLNYLNRKLSRNFWLETFQKLLIGNFPETFGWKLLLLVGNFQKLLGSIGNFPGTFGWKLSRHVWLETFQKLLVGNFYYWLETFQKLLAGNFL